MPKFARTPSRQRILLNNPPTNRRNDTLHHAPNFGSTGLTAVAGYLRSVADCERLAARLNAEQPAFAVMTPYPGTEVVALRRRRHGLLRVGWRRAEPKATVGGPAG